MCFNSHVFPCRLLLEVMEAVAAAVGPARVGLRLSPYNTFLDACDSVERAVEKNVWLMQELDRRVPGLAYMHMVGGVCRA
jgi:2,4-dienoyl-CoA reductase-like NADH-dependent reductase (Old Yellow Enzyme family)